ncbi:PP2C family protein-serine/threonine phosphatase [Brevundimonas sp. DC300-4]|uniref:PP2C family protein-serine/threonine phosphatase n=1 Tax=Brevundimonas sp. DC300-4 TaxID=2804594 RepID=UPI003CF38861
MATVKYSGSVKSRTPLSVLIAEDDELQRAYLMLELERFGCQTHGVEDGAQALLAIADRHFDVLITDWQMPEVDGLDLIRKVRTGYADLPLHVILITARNADTLTRQALEAGADGFLRKPVDELQLELAVASSRRAVALHRRLARRNRRLKEAQSAIRDAYRLVRRDLEAAAELQRRLLPPVVLQGPVQFAWSMQQSLHIGGDTVGAKPLSNGRVLFFQVDVSGHGVPAALGSFMLHNRLSQLCPATPEALIETALTLNREILDQVNDSYATALLMLVEADGARAWIVRAGHPLPLLLRAAGGVEWISEGGPPLGLLPAITLAVEEVDLSIGDRLLVYSDGVTESSAPTGEPLGEDGLVQWCEAHRGGTLPDFVDALASGIERMRAGRPPEDDISMLIIQRTAEPVK